MKSPTTRYGRVAMAFAALMAIGAALGIELDGERVEQIRRVFGLGLEVAAMLGYGEAVRRLGAHARDDPYPEL